MCGRFTLRGTPDALEREFEVQKVPLFKPRFNVAPTQRVPVVGISPEDGSRILRFLRWGLIPHWARDASSTWIMARSETVATKPAFRDAYKRQRCLIPADGWYEWLERPEGKQPHFIRLSDDRPFAFAAVWERWRSPRGETIASCALLTREADGRLRAIHARMPVVVDRELYACWLDPASGEGELWDCLRGRSGDCFESHAIGNRVNNVRNDDPDLVVPLE